MRFLVASLVLLLLAAPAAGEPAALEVEATPSRVVEIVDGDTLFLDDGREVRLVGIQAPKLPLGRPDFETWPLAEDAKAALAGLALDRDVRLGYGGTRMDRHGRVLAQLYRDDGLWIQGALLEQGMARVYSFADNRALIADMLSLERAARAARRGIWAHPYYAIRDPAETGEHLQTFQLVEGRVREASRVGANVYLNYGDDWRRDFTVRLDADARRLFEAAGLDPLSLAGHRIRVRGWLRRYNGALIEATHPEQIEVLAE